MPELKDIPVEVTMVDGSRWLVYYRLGALCTYAEALRQIGPDIRDGRLMPADDLDGVQRRLSQINMAYVVSFREPEVDGPKELNGSEHRDGVEL
jgi:hypothetical protein